MKRQAPAEQVLRQTRIVVELELEPFEGGQGPLIVAQQHVERADRIPLAAPVVVGTEILLLLRERALVAAKAGAKLLLFGLSDGCFLTFGTRMIQLNGGGGDPVRLGSGVANFWIRARL
jgi:hypothetical protein